MMVYFAKVILLSAILAGIYRTVFQRETMYRFNRVYLLLTPLLALLIPLFTIPIPESLSQVSYEWVAASSDTNLPHGMDPNRLDLPPASSASAEGYDVP
ncbi:MAG: hypothetical protein AAFQ98_05640, partial [Bacteroidota bacterium]